MKIDTNYYFTFTADHPEDDARKKFKERFGVEPLKVFIEQDQLKVGPIPSRSGSYEAQSDDNQLRMF